MSKNGTRYANDEIAKRGDALYERTIRSRLKRKDNGRLVAIDIETGEYELGDSVLEACDKLQARLPNAETWVVRVGSSYVYRFGSSGVREQEQ